ncbi:FecR family protein [uncultured Aquimarina sp.]|uniref:FecR family protein n=1 Tax=uncultured Aquimarina sp. TaxID=575652 RepID=UPI00262E77EE|nr:FecR family protein [uncultured Aquimarina sp.]
MQNPYSDETFLARWLNNDLDPKEKMEFENSEEYQKYKVIVDKVAMLGSPAYDKKQNLQRIKKNMLDATNSTKVISFAPKWIYSIAATLLVLIGLFFFFNRSTVYTTNYGEQMTVQLLDGSEVILNSKSKLSYKKSDWNDSRKVVLLGEAFFKVTKGSNFIVESNSGTVQVLGTQFNMNTRKDFFEVICHEGKVKAIGPESTGEATLTKGNAFRIANSVVENWNTKSSLPSWLSGETTFTNTPLNQVIQSLENQFNISFDTTKIDLNKRFTGSYSHQNIELALKTIFVPMEISYTFNNENNIVLVKE